MVYLTRVEHFNAAHKLYNPLWDEEKNKEVFGICSNANWHGHNYELHVTVKGIPDPETGFIVNAKTLGSIIREKVVDQMDHKNLNLDVPFLKGKLTSTENVAIAVWNELVKEIADLGATLHCIKIQETPKIYVEYFGG